MHNCRPRPSSATPNKAGREALLRERGFGSARVSELSSRTRTYCIIACFVRVSSQRCVGVGCSSVRLSFLEISRPSLVIQSAVVECRGRGFASASSALLSRHPVAATPAVLVVGAVFRLCVHGARLLLCWTRGRNVRRANVGVGVMGAS